MFLGGLAIGLFSSNKSKPQASKESSQKADQGDSSKILVQDNTFDTVVTAKSKDIDNIKLFKEPGKKKKAGKVQEGVPCALLQEKTVKSLHLQNSSLLLLSDCIINALCQKLMSICIKMPIANCCIIKSTGYDMLFHIGFLYGICHVRKNNIIFST